MMRRLKRFMSFIASGVATVFLTFFVLNEIASFLIFVQNTFGHIGMLGIMGITAGFVLWSATLAFHWDKPKDKDA